MFMYIPNLGKILVALFSSNPARRRISNRLYQTTYMKVSCFGLPGVGGLITSTWLSCSWGAFLETQARPTTQTSLSTVLESTINTMMKLVVWGCRCICSLRWDYGLGICRPTRSRQHVTLNNDWKYPFASASLQD